MIFKNQSTVNFKCCVYFRCMAKLFGYMNMHVFSFRVFSVIGYYKLLSIVPCAMQWIPVYLFYMCVLTCVQLFMTPWTSPPGSSVHGIFQAKLLEWVAISYSRGSSWPKDQTQVSHFSCIGGFFTPTPPGKSSTLYIVVCVC